MSLRIYFAGSIRGGREDAVVYGELIALIGADAMVLTEHVADPDGVDAGRSDREIFERDIGWLEECDAVVAEVTTPSLGVGYELAIAESMGKPVLCLFRPGATHRLSAMVAGNAAFGLAEYRSVADAGGLIRRFLEKLRD